MAPPLRNAPVPSSLLDTELTHDHYIKIYTVKTVAYNPVTPPLKAYYPLY